jgi:CheY-like chemotaxis protein
LIILDLMMPVMSGWEFRKQQLSDPRLKSLPLVITSATRWRIK